MSGLIWNDVTYQPGELKVLAYKEGNPWAEDLMKTTAEPSQLGLAVDRDIIAADGRDLAFVTVSIDDNAGLIVPRSNGLVKFQIDGPGKLIAVDNGYPISVDPFQARQRKAFNGLCLAIIKSTKTPGAIKLKASSEGLKGVSMTITSK